MTRFWVIPMLIILPLAAGLGYAGEAKSKDFQAKGALTKDDPKDARRGGPSQVHTVPLKAGVVYTIDMVSTEFDSYLRLLDPKGNQLEEDDDGGVGLNARIIFNCSKDGDYKVVCTTFGADMKGNYTVQVKSTGIVQKSVGGHAQMLGKPAPDFNADFAVNGKPRKLADLKNKVVLLYFWEVRSTPSTAFNPALVEWHKAHKADGLEIVGVTYYPSDIGQKLGFDKENAAVIGVKKADRASDQALLGVYAAHHKIEHLLLTLSKQDALAAFDLYVVNSYPQAVLIDRKGIVRAIDITGEKGRASLEAEIKKLLAEK